MTSKDRFATPNTILVGKDIMTLIYPWFYEAYASDEKINLWFVAQPRTWPRGVQLDWVNR